MPNISSGPCQLELFLAFGSLFRIAMKDGHAIMAPRMFVIVFGICMKRKRTLLHMRRASSGEGN